MGLTCSNFRERLISSFKFQVFLLKRDILFLKFQVFLLKIDNLRFEFYNFRLQTYNHLIVCWHRLFSF